MSEAPVHSDRFLPRITELWYPAVFAWLLIAALSAQAQAFVEISAELDFLAYRGDDPQGGSNASPRTVHLVCTTGTNEWRIDHDFVQGGKHAWYFDGTNVYSSIRVMEPMPEEMRTRTEQTSRFATVPFEVARSNLTISIWPSRDGHPMGDWPANVAWLAFSSGAYLKRDGRLVPLTLDDLHHTRDRFAYTDKTETFEDEFGLPRTVDLFLSKALFLTSETEFDREYSFGDRYTEWTKKTAAKLLEGAQMFHYAVSAATNFLGWNFPLSFECVQNGRKFEQNGDWYWRVSGRVKSIQPSAKPKGLFDSTLQQSIVDHRFHDETNQVGAIIYQSTNAFALPTTDPELQEKFARWVKRAAAEAEKRKARN